MTSAIRDPQNLTHADLFPETLLVNLDHGHSFTTTLKIADHFGKRHDHVLRDIRQLFDDLNGPKSGAIESNSGFIEANFLASDYTDSRGRAKPMYRLSRNAFALLAMGFTGREALLWKIKFLDAFDAMEAELHAKTLRFAAALDQVRPSLRPVVEGTQGGLNRAAIAAPLGKSCAAVTYHRKAARRLGLLRD